MQGRIKLFFHPPTWFTKRRNIPMKEILIQCMKYIDKVTKSNPRQAQTITINHGYMYMYVWVHGYTIMRPWKLYKNM